jgi:2-polyprenyl-3-methyl-5-hydroxy-6-metoxy-1,4-benzoquinol methylase
MNRPIAASAMPEKWYEVGHADHFWFRWRLHALERFCAELGIPTGEPLRALDVGCGRGLLIEQLEGATRWIVDGVDVNEAAVASAWRGRGNIACYDVHRPPPARLGAYQIVILCDVLEHVADPVALLRAIASHLRSGGWLLINVPAIAWLFSGYDRAVGHHRRYSRASLGREIGSAGSIGSLRFRYWGFPMIPLLAARKLWLDAWPGTRSADAVIEAGFSLRSPIGNRFLDGLGRWEAASGLRFPIGTSLLAGGRKQ